MSLTKKAPLISIVIPTHNRKELLFRLIKSILSGNYKHIEIIIVDDASSDKTYEQVYSKYKKNKKIKIIRNKTNLQTAASKNKGIKMAKGKYLFFVDDDNILSKKTISSLVDLIESDTNIGEVGPVIYYLKPKTKVFWSYSKLNMCTAKTKIVSSLQNLGEIWETDEIPNSYMIRSSVLKKNEIYFNSNLGIMYEDSEIAYKIKKLGYKILVSKNAKIYHDVPHVSKDKTGFYHIMIDENRAYYIARNRLRFYADFSTWLQILGIALFWNWIFLVYYVFHILFYLGPGKFTLQKRAYITYTYFHGILDGYTYLFKKKLTI